MLHLSDSPLLFCFFKDGWLDDELCSSEDLETWVDGTVIAGGPCFATVTAVFFPAFFDPSDEAGGGPSSCSFLLVVLFG